MGRKTDLIEELEGSLAAYKSLIDEIATALDMRVPELTRSNVVGITARFVTELTALVGEERARRRPGTGALSGSNLPAFDDLDSEIDRANQQATGQAMTIVSSSGGGAISPSSDPVALQLEAIAHELGTSVQGLTVGAALEEIHRELLRIKNPGADISEDTGNRRISKGDSLAQAIEHNLGQLQHMETELVRNRGIVGRVASAMQIGQWDAEGTEILEKVQRWETFKHVLGRRIRELDGAARADQSDPVPGPIARELESHLARLMAPKEFAKWLENKPKGTVSAAVAEVAALPVPEFTAFTVQHLTHLANHVREPVHGDNRIYLDETIWDVAHSATASEEFVRLMNLVILPIVARQRAATGAAPGYLGCKWPTAR